MKNPNNKVMQFAFGATMLGVFAVHGHAQLLTNGGFEAGLTGWTILDQIGSDGTFFVQSGTTSPVNGFPVMSPPEGTNAVMTDSGAGGSHVLYQDFVVPTGIANASLSFDRFINSGDAFFSPSNLDWAATNRTGGQNLNQQARVDFISPSADPFSVGATDVLLNLFQTRPGDALTSGYSTISADVTALFLANPGQTLRLRFAEVDNVSFFNFGVDNVRFSVQQAVPEPGAMALLLAIVGTAGVWVNTKYRKAMR